MQNYDFATAVPALLCKAVSTWGYAGTRKPRRGVRRTGLCKNELSGGCSYVVGAGPVEPRTTNSGSKRSSSVGIGLPAIALISRATTA